MSHITYPISQVRGKATFMANGFRYLARQWDENIKDEDIAMVQVANILNDERASSIKFSVPENELTMEDLGQYCVELRSRLAYLGIDAMQPITPDAVWGNPQSNEIVSILAEFIELYHPLWCADADDIAA